jgi:hypothetical protein
MRWKARFAITIVLALVSSLSAHAQGTQAPPLARVDYATFMQQDNEERLRTFNRITPENRADLLVSQVGRWMEVNRSWLTPEQLRVLRDFISVVAPALFRLPGYKDTLAWRNQLAARAEKLFSPAQIRQAFTIYADYIPLPQPLPQSAPVH